MPQGPTPAGRRSRRCLRTAWGSGTMCHPGISVRWVSIKLSSWINIRVQIFVFKKEGLCFKSIILVLNKLACIHILMTYLFIDSSTESHLHGLSHPESSWLWYSALARTTDDGCIQSRHFYDCATMSRVSGGQSHTRFSYHSAYRLFVWIYTNHIVVGRHQ